MKQTRKINRCKICSGRLRLVCDGLYDERYGYPRYYKAMECGVCQLIQILPPLRDSDLSDLYTKYYPRQSIDPQKIKYLGTLFHPTQLWRVITWLAGRSNIGHYQTQTGETVLDVACGDGLSLLEIKTLGGRAFGTEADRNVGKVAKTLRLNLFIGDLRDAPWPLHSFDLITGNQIIEHVPDPVEFLTTIKKHLKSSGRVIIATPNFGGIGRRFFGRRWINWHIPYHQNLFNAVSLTFVSQKAGFTVTRRRTVTPNLWTFLQLGSVVRPTRPGDRQTAIWQVDPPKSLGRILLKSAYLFVSWILLIPVTIWNRLVDWVGYGESLVYELRPLS